MRTMVEVILRDGIETRSLNRSTPSTRLNRSFARWSRSAIRMLLAQCLQEGQDVETEARKTVAFLLRAITPRS